MSEWTDWMDRLGDTVEQMAALKRAGVPVDPREWTEADLERASEVLNELAAR